MKTAFEAQRWRVSWGCFGLGLAIIFFCLLQGCTSSLPPIDVSFWAGDSKKEGISRSQEDKTVACRDPDFDEYTCLTYEDVKKIYSTLLRCKQWSVETMTTDQSLLLIKKNSEVIQRVVQQDKKLEPLLH